MPDLAGPLLLERARTGDRDALEQLLTHHQTQVYRFGLKVCRDHEDARDVVQDTLFAMAREIRDFRSASSISTWLYTIARNFCARKRRRGKFAPAIEESIDAGAGIEALALADPAKDPHDLLVDKRLEVALAAAIGALEPKYREVLLLRDVEGLATEDVASRLDLSVQAVKSRLHRARQSVRQSLSGAA